VVVEDPYLDTRRWARVTGLSDLVGGSMRSGGFGI
jgi:hypothetical protein